MLLLCGLAGASSILLLDVDIMGLYRLGVAYKKVLFAVIRQSAILYSVLPQIGVEMNDDND